MTTAYNLRNKMYASGSAGRATRLDPGSAGTLIVTPVDRAVCIMTGAGTRTLEAAAGVPLGTSILCISQTDAIIVAGAANITIANGTYVELVVTKDSNGDNQWVAKSGTAGSTFPVDIGVYSLDGTAGDNTLAIVQLVDALEAAGIVTPAWTAV